MSLPACDLVILSLVAYCDYEHERFLKMVIWQGHLLHHLFLHPQPCVNLRTRRHTPVSCRNVSLICTKDLNTLYTRGFFSYDCISYYVVPHISCFNLLLCIFSLYDVCLSHLNVSLLTYLCVKRRFFIFLFRQIQVKLEGKEKL